MLRGRSEVENGRVGRGKARQHLIGFDGSGHSFLLSWWEELRQNIGEQLWDQRVKGRRRGDGARVDDVEDAGGPGERQ